MIRRPRVSFATILSVAGLCVSASAASAQNSDQIYNFITNKCLQPVNRTTAQGAAIVQEPCDGGTAQLWTRVSAGGSAVHFVNVFTKLCLDARGGAANHTPIQQWTCNGISNEKWQPGDDGDDIIPPLFSLVSGTHNYCLDIPGGQGTAGLAMQLYRCNGTGAQEWWTP